MNLLQKYEAKVSELEMHLALANREIKLGRQIINTLKIRLEQIVSLNLPTTTVDDLQAILFLKNIAKAALKELEDFHDSYID